ncbi:MAG TPA: hypothetical protein DDW52_06870, partial [Planctomycetaceae bacterium]|nr:hypothetical protein [Planctomycetaceae bacterium]
MTHQGSIKHHPSDADQVPATNVHQWKGHRIRVETDVSATTLWGRNFFIVYVDEIPRTKSKFYRGHTLRFCFQHNQRFVSGMVTPVRGLFGPQMYGVRMNYQIDVDGQRVGTGTTRNNSCWKNLVAWLLYFLVFGILLCLWIHYEP